MTKHNPKNDKGKMLIFYIWQWKFSDNGKWQKTSMTVFKIYYVVMLVNVDKYQMTYIHTRVPPTPYISLNHLVKNPLVAWLLEYEYALQTTPNPLYIHVQCTFVHHVASLENVHHV